MENKRWKFNASFKVTLRFSPVAERGKAPLAASGC
jgi:hypothetical protein